MHLALGRVQLLHGIEVLQISILSLTVKCDRCRTPNDMTGLKPGVEKKGSCKKCGTQLTALFRQQLANRAVPWETTTAYLAASVRQPS